MRALWTLLLTPILTCGCGGGATPSPSAPSPAGASSEAVAPASPTGDLTVVETLVSFSVVEGSVPDDPGIETMVAPFRDRMGEEIRQVIGETTGTLSKAVPEGTLGNFATDAMLWAANALLPEPAHLALTNNGGLRIPIGAGPITMGQMYELMPFENNLSVLVLTGSQVKVLCDQLAEIRGEPIAGFSFRIAVDGDSRVAREIMVGDDPLDPAAEYRLVTNDYMASGGDAPPILQSSLARQDLPILLRDAFIEYVRFLGVIEPKLEGRIAGGIGR